MDKLLILGGTNFVGRNLIESLLQLENFEITTFNRGVSNPDLFPEIRKLHGDRETEEIDVIFNEKWDYIIDLSCYFPHSLSQITSQISKSVKRYIFISTCSVYDNEVNRSILCNENATILDCSEIEKIDSSVTTYGNRKAECERIIQRSGIRYSIFRPALIYGQYDTTDRFYYWLYHLKKENELLVPNNGENVFSVTYVKDLIKAIIRTLTEELKSDTYTITTYPTLSISKLMETAIETLETKSITYAASSEFLKGHHIAEWTDLPLWLDCDYYTYDNKKMLEDLKIQPTDFKLSVKETVDYYERIGWKEPNYGMSEVTKNKLIQQLNNP